MSLPLTIARRHTALFGAANAESGAQGSTLRSTLKQRHRIRIAATRASIGRLRIVR